MGITVLNRNGHMTTCTQFCARQHCKCGKDAMHGTKSCSVCATQARETQTVVDCATCHDMQACSAHVGRKIKCARCCGTGAFITGTLNGKPVGPGGACFRCGGKGHHTTADRKRNNDYERYGRRY
jgi:hypothetical protein